jgi:glycerol-3-phosphate acyltransferase PlsX
MRIALDAMGGDNAPGPIVAGALQAVAADSELQLVLVGDREQVEPLLPAGPERERVELFHCSQVVGMDEKPVVALRTKPDNSIKRCWELLAAKKVNGIVSAGNTGAMVACGHVLKQVLPGVERAGIATVLPTEKGPCVLIDVGANAEAKAEHLFQYGIMGAAYAKHILKIADPTIGLLNVGEEEVKGHPVVKEAHTLLSQLGPRFKGNVEGRDVPRGTTQVVVCDGFVGNILLKYSESVVKFLMGTVQTEVLSQLSADREKVLGAWKALAVRYDWATYGGAPLLGTDGACIICHGSSGERAIKNALKVAAEFARVHLNEMIVQELQAATPK